MALLFSAVTVTAGSIEEEFLVGGIPTEYDDLIGWSAFDDFIEQIPDNTEVTVHAEVYLYGEGETYSAAPAEIAYFMNRINSDSNFLSGHCDNIEDFDFSFCRSFDQEYEAEVKGYELL